MESGNNRIQKLVMGLKSEGIVSTHHNYNTRDLHTLNALIENEQDWKEYVAVWKGNERKYHLSYILLLFKRDKERERA